MLAHFCILNVHFFALHEASSLITDKAGAERRSRNRFRDLQDLGADKKRCSSATLNLSVDTFFKRAKTYDRIRIIIFRKIKRKY